jgi:hypothetical protein
MKTYYNEKGRKITMDLKAARSAVNSGQAGLLDDPGSC